MFHHPFKLMGSSTHFTNSTAHGHSTGSRDGTQSSPKAHSCLISVALSPQAPGTATYFPDFWQQGAVLPTLVLGNHAASALLSGSFRLTLFGEIHPDCLWLWMVHSPCCGGISNSVDHTLQEGTPCFTAKDTPLCAQLTRSYLGVTHLALAAGDRANLN